MRDLEEASAGAALGGEDVEGEHEGIVNENAEILEISAITSAISCCVSPAVGYPGCGG